MPTIRAMRLLNVMEAGTLSGAQLEALLTTDPALLADFRLLLAALGQSARMVAAPTSRAALLASPAALGAFSGSAVAVRAMAANATAMAALVASSDAMAIAAASPVAMDALAASSTAKMALFNSDAALNAIAASSAALTAMRAAAQFAIFNTGSTTFSPPRPLVGPVATGSYIALGCSTSNATTGATITLANRRSGSSRPNTMITAAGNVSSTAALGLVVSPMVTPFTAGSTNNTTQIIYAGMLRCDV